MNLEYRMAVPDDAVECIWLRGKTRENAVSPERLNAIGITAESWSNDIRTGALPGHICRASGKMIGYCFGSSAEGEIVVLALLPEYEGQGIGKTLLSKMTADLIELGNSRLFLGCSADPKSRSYGFYRNLGWRSTGKIDRYGDEILEYYSKAAGSRQPEA
jgi:ribosomal protein S18 acetylase RimI-like enzyme